MADSSRKAIVTASSNVPIRTPEGGMDVRIFNDAIKNKGYQANIERAVMCPCIANGTNAPLTSCLNCGGTGWIFIDLAQTYLLCQSMSSLNKYEVWSETNRGTVNISARADDKLGFMDRVTLLELEAWFSEIKQVLLNNAQTTYFFFLTYQPIEIFDVYLFIGPGVPLVPVNSTNFTVTANKLAFTSGFIQNFLTTNNLTAVTATIRYTHNPTYYVIDINRDLIKQPGKNGCGVPLVDGVNELKVNFPIRCVGRKAHYVLDAPSFSGDRLFDNTNYNRTPPNYNPPTTPSEAPVVNEPGPEQWGSVNW